MAQGRKYESCLMEVLDADAAAPVAPAVTTLKVAGHEGSAQHD